MPMQALFKTLILTLSLSLISCGWYEDQNDYPNPYYANPYGGGAGQFAPPQGVVVRYDQMGQAQYMTMNQPAQWNSQEQFTQAMQTGYQNYQWQQVNNQQVVDQSYPSNPNNSMYFVQNPSSFQPSEPVTRSRDRASNYWHNSAYNCGVNYGFANYGNYCANSNWYHMYPPYTNNWAGYWYMPTYYNPTAYGSYYAGYYYYNPAYTCAVGGYNYAYYNAWW